MKYVEFEGKANEWFDKYGQFKEGIKPEVVALQSEIFKLEISLREKRDQLAALIGADKLEVLELDVRTFNSLRRCRIETVDQLMVFFNEPGRVFELMEVRNFGELSLKYTVRALISHGYLSSNYRLPDRYATD